MTLETDWQNFLKCEFETFCTITSEVIGLQKRTIRQKKHLNLTNIIYIMLLAPKMTECGQKIIRNHSQFLKPIRKFCRTLYSTQSIYSGFRCNQKNLSFDLVVSSSNYGFYLYLTTEKAGNLNMSILPWRGRRGRGRVSLHSYCTWFGPPFLEETTSFSLNLLVHICTFKSRALNWLKGKI